ncbi:MAG TPA: DUF4097 family beta strand repeat-containing protein, partial [Gammaproteobacteria bacterium]|nr:DUF4097 family beta strand repeat-containing protein [Gammaproteobacteria bacterium]
MNLKRTLALSAALLAMTPAAEAQIQTVNRSLDAPAAGHVVITLVDGDVTVRGWDSPTIEISGQLGAGAQELEVGQQRNETRIRVIERPDDVAAGDVETELFVSVPAGSSLAIDGTNTDLLVANVRGTLSLHTVSGDIEAEFFGATVTAETVGGDIRVSARDAAGEATLTTVAGEIEAGGPFRTITASTVSGDIELDVLDAAMLSLNSTNGDIEVHATFDGAAELTAETINGDVELRVGEEGNLNLDAGTFSGRIDICF